ncbi:MAG TPA: 23S rRNA (adenine(1618)-N(6))-methyltransferase RlmF [Chromobacteriaceae bacterium]|nr:23S rRNA (adenine(1618)-N(6))-methyltransferase RlmF [Chromobacteriaceae bacterium]
MRAKSSAAKAAKPASGLHPRNRHQGRYDFAALCAACPELAAHVVSNPYGDPSINFADPVAVKLLNRALLQSMYGVRDWDIPAGSLCPPIPGRADYLHCLADLLARSHNGIIPRGPGVCVLDIGVGANCVYPLIGHAEYGWSFVGADIDQGALANAQAILAANAGLELAIELRRQPSANVMFNNVIRSDDYFDLTLCNPPFHGSMAEATAGTQRKWKNLGKAQSGKKGPTLNFGGQHAELWCPGGEESFVTRMIMESRQFAAHCLWFTSLIAKAASLPAVYRALQQAGVRDSKTINMAQGQKQSRLVAWTFFDLPQRQEWRQRSDDKKRS